jgi:hypothetical protein
MMRLKNLHMYFIQVQCSNRSSLYYSQGQLDSGWHNTNVSIGASIFSLKHISVDDGIVMMMPHIDKRRSKTNHYLQYELTTKTLPHSSD